MKIRSPSLVELHAFLAVCRHGSFRRAADELCVTQAAVSRAVQRLEEHLQGSRLFERNSAGVSLTARGEQLRKLTERHVLALELAAETLGRASMPLLGRELVPVCAPALSPQFHRPGDFLSASLLHHTNFPDNWALWLAQAGVADKPQLGPGFDLTMHLIVAAKAGMGVAVVPRCLVQKELQAGELVMPFDTTVSCGRGYYLCWNQDAPRFAARDRFAAWLVEQADADNQPEGGLSAAL